MKVSAKRKKWRKNKSERCHYVVIRTGYWDFGQTGSAKWVTTNRIISGYRIHHTYKSLWRWLETHLGATRHFRFPIVEIGDIIIPEGGEKVARQLRLQQIERGTTRSSSEANT